VCPTNYANKPNNKLPKLEESKKDNKEVEANLASIEKCGPLILLEL
jgi:hypothetical protein